jgi:hypothetical protein
MQRPGALHTRFDRLKEDPQLVGSCWPLIIFPWRLIVYSVDDSVNDSAAVES